MYTLKARPLACAVDCEVAMNNNLNQAGELLHLYGGITNELNDDPDDIAALLRIKAAISEKEKPAIADMV